MLAACLIPAVGATLASPSLSRTSLSHALVASRLPAQELNGGSQVLRESRKSVWRPQCGLCLHGGGQAKAQLQDFPSRAMHIAGWRQTSFAFWASELKGPIPLGFYPSSRDDSSRNMNCSPSPQAASSWESVFPVRRHISTPSLAPRFGGGQERPRQVV